jgi:hypothetical protein
MTMTKRTHLIVAAAAISALVLTGCGKSTDGENTTAGDSTQLTTNAEATSTTAFGTTLKLGTTATILFSVPVAYTPTVFASNFQKGWKANKLEVTITNTGSTDLDTASIAFAISSGANVCTDILDGDNGINGAPTTPLAAGATTTFSYGVGCDAKVGDPLQITATIGSDIVAVTGKLA